MSFSTSDMESTDSVSFTEDAGAIDDSTSEVLNVWTLTRDQRLTQLAGASLTNNSSYDIPPGFVSVSGEEFQSRTLSGMGSLAEASFKSPDGTLLNGTATIEAGDVSNQFTANGLIYVTVAPSSNVTQGADGDSSAGAELTYDLSVAGISFTGSFTGPSKNFGTVTYGSVEGQVLDAAGEPVAEDGIKTAGLSTTTDANGNYSLFGPGGESVTVTALAETSEIDVTFNGGVTTQQDFQYGGIDAFIALPDGTAIPGIEVTGDKIVGSGITGDDGKASFDRVGTSGDVTVEFSNGAESTTIAAPGGGKRGEAKITVGFGVKGTCKTNSGEKVERVDIKTTASRDLVSTTRTDGTFAVGGDKTGKIDVIIGDEDRRYQTEAVTLTVADGDVLEEIIILERRRAVTQR